MVVPRPNSLHFDALFLISLYYEVFYSERATCCADPLSFLATMYRTGTRQGESDYGLHSRRSNAAHDKLHEAQSFHGLGGKILPNHLVTRWWSITTEVEGFVENKLAVDKLCVWASTRLYENITKLPEAE